MNVFLACDVLKFFIISELLEAGTKLKSTYEYIINLKVFIISWIMLLIYI
jgi:hypothetical protein